ncbi:MAG: pilus assembly protein [Rhizobium sp.]|nr:pilus assembly protein [Rhizobium sp.]
MLSVFRRLCRDRKGNIAFTFALLAVPLIVAIGVSFDFVRAYNARRDMQNDLDAAVLAAVNDVDTLSEQKLRDRVKVWFAAQSELQPKQYKLTNAAISIDKTNHTISAVATGTIPTTLLRVAQIKKVDVRVKTSVAGPAAAYLNVYVLLDKSASMMLAATTGDQAKMKKYAGGCTFACHIPEGDHAYNGTTYHNNYDLAKAMGVQLRADVSVNAVGKVLDMITAEDPHQTRIKIGFYTMGTTTSEALAPTTSISSARQTLLNDSKGLTSKTSSSSTYFDKALPELAKLIGTAGDGSTSQKPRKLVLLLTDGVQSARDWVHNDPNLTTPLNPDWCKGVKDTGADLGVLYTEYLPITGDWGYDRTLGQSMKSSDYTSVWKGTMPPGNEKNMLRRDYISAALAKCSSKPALFLSASHADDIETGLSSIFEQYLAMVRITG